MKLNYVSHLMNKWK